MDPRPAGRGSVDGGYPKIGVPQDPKIGVPEAQNGLKWTQNGVKMTPYAYVSSAFDCWIAIAKAVDDIGGNSSCHDQGWTTTATADS